MTLTPATKLMAALVLPLLILLGMVGVHAQGRLTSDVVTLKIEAYDPRDILRGQYLQFRYVWPDKSWEGKYPDTGRFFIPETASAALESLLLDGKKAFTIEARVTRTGLIPERLLIDGQGWEQAVAAYTPPPGISDDQYRKFIVPITPPTTAYSAGLLRFDADYTGIPAEDTPPEGPHQYIAVSECWRENTPYPFAPETLQNLLASAPERFTVEMGKWSPQSPMQINRLMIDGQDYCDWVVEQHAQTQQNAGVP